ncbi:MAG: hypothetical protein VXW32_16455 [Myxococcota bacterium]|nr:hypothetical protein [Myxococcota bacterium]
MKPIVVFLGFAACTTPPPSVLDDPEGGFFDRPFPHADRTHSDGSPDYTGFPNPSASPLIERYVEVAQGLEGFSTVAPITFRFSKPIDATMLPSPNESLNTDASVLLVDMDPTSPQFGQLIPIQTHWQRDATSHQASNLLSLAPVYGIPLRPQTTYLALIRTRIAGPDEALSARLQAAETGSVDAQIHGVLNQLGIPTDEVAALTYFQTQDTLSEMDDYAWWIRNNLPMPSLEQTLRYGETDKWFRSFVGRMEVPLWQAGEKPYSTSGGGFLRSESSNPMVVTWEQVKFSLTIPSGVEEPEAGWPVLIYSHGTGGSYKSCCWPNDKLGPARQLARRGIATFGISQPLHADRTAPGTDESLHTFNYLNPESARHNFRQGALDIVYQTTLLSSQSHELHYQEERFRLDPSKIVFMGHSQGGITGAIAGPFVGDQIQGMVLSGAGGGMSITLTQRKDIVDIEALIREMLNFSIDEELTELHPVSGLIQVLTDITDPLNYARYWMSEPASPYSRPLPVLLTEGLLDEQTPSRTSEALGAAGGLPILEPVAHVSTAHDLLGLDFQKLPAAGNQTDWTDNAITAGLAQYAEEDHFAVFDSKPAAELVYDFLRTAIDGDPSLGVSPELD